MVAFLFFFSPQEAASLLQSAKPTEVAEAPKTWSGGFSGTGQAGQACDQRFVLGPTKDQFWIHGILDETFGSWKETGVQQDLFLGHIITT